MQSKSICRQRMFDEYGIPFDEFEDALPDEYHADVRGAVQYMDGKQALQRDLLASAWDDEREQLLDEFETSSDAEREQLLRRVATEVRYGKSQGGSRTR